MEGIHLNCLSRSAELIYECRFAGKAWCERPNLPNRYQFGTRGATLHKKCEFAANQLDLTVLRPSTGCFGRRRVRYLDLESGVSIGIGTNWHIAADLGR